MAEVLEELMRGKIIEGKPISQNRLAEVTGIPQPTISRILSGKHETLRLDNMMALADYFEVSLDQLTGRVPLDKKPLSKEAMAVAEIVDSLDPDGRRRVQEGAEREKLWEQINTRAA